MKKKTPARAQPAIGLREQKAAATRVALARALDERLAGAPLADITVDELAADAGVSRVTFFNYFPSKERALEYVFVLWLHGMLAEVSREGYRGRRALEFLFERFAQRAVESPMRVRRMLGYFAVRTGEQPLPELGPAERLLVAGEVEVERRSFGQHLTFFIEEARDAGEIELGASSPFEMAHLAGSLLFGASLAGPRPDLDWPALYRHHFERAFGAPRGRSLQAKKKKGTRR